MNEAGVVGSVSDINRALPDHLGSRAGSTDLQFQHILMSFQEFFHTTHETIQLLIGCI